MGCRFPVRPLVTECPVPFVFRGDFSDPALFEAWCDSSAVGETLEEFAERVSAFRGDMDAVQIEQHIGAG